MSEDLIDWLRAQFDVDERVARAAQDLERDVFDGTGVIVMHAATGTRSVTLSSAVAIHIARHDPARVLREVESLRKIIEVHDPSRAEYPEIGDCPVCISDQSRYPELWNSDKAPCATLRLLAAIFSGRPGFREEWR